MSKNRSLLWVDLALFVVLMATIVTVSADLFVHTFIHVALGVSLCVIALLHLSLHWSWIKNTGQRYDRLPEPARRYAWLNIGLFCAYILCGSVGLSARELLFPFHMHVFLGVLHTCTAALVIVLQVIHISRHWKWITAMVEKMIAL